MRSHYEADPGCWVSTGCFLGLVSLAEGIDLRMGVRPAKAEIRGRI